MNILFVAPLPPPIHGQSYVSDVLLTEIKKSHKIEVVNFTKKRNAGGFYFIRRYFEVFDVLYLIYTRRKNQDAVYITISQSFLGNIKDLITYIILYNNLSKVTIHLHGGAIKRELWDRYPLLLNINKFFIEKMNAVIISGDSHRNIFSGLIDENKICVVPNFAMNEIFIKESDLATKFEKTIPLKLLYISGMRTKKGYLDLLQAYKLLPLASQNRVSISFAGEFESNEEHNVFIQEIKKYENLSYHGVVTDNEKIKLFQESQVFCLPTKYLEGQPISILEAYASGCCVLTTQLGGISDIFDDQINGFGIEPNNASSIAVKIEFCLTNLERVREIAFFNLKDAVEKYSKDFFVKSTLGVMLNDKR